MKKILLIISITCLIGCSSIKPTVYAPRFEVQARVQMEQQKKLEKRRKDDRDTLLAFLGALVAGYFILNQFHKL